MDDSVAGVVLAAGAGTRLAPLTRIVPKPLCPVGDRPLVDHALARVATATASVAVNLHHGAEALDAHLPGGVHRSFEEPEALGTAGALGALRPWIDGRATLVANADVALHPDVDLAPVVAGWDRERVRLLCVRDPARGDFGDLRYCGVALMPWHLVAGLDATPSGLYEVCWRVERAAGRLDLVEVDATFHDCGTPADYLAANLTWSGGRPVVGEGATIGTGARLERTVVWPGAQVAEGEVLTDAIRTTAGTVLVRRVHRDPGATHRG